MKRVVLDTSILVSSALGKRVGDINDAWRTGKFMLIVSGDKHRLDLNEFRSISIRTGRGLLDRLKANG